MDKQELLKRIEAKNTANIQLARLLDYYKGQHDILFRTFSDKDKPNNKIVANYCATIADFFNAYLLGIPVKYASENTALLEAVQSVFDYNDEAEHNVGLGESMNIFGYGAEILYIDADKQIRFKSLDPRETIFIYAKDIEGALETVIRFFLTTEDTYAVEVYDAKTVTTYTMNKTFTEITEVSTIQHVFQSPPLVRYDNNPLLQGSFEGIMDLQDALNKLLSDEINDFEQFVDAYLVLTGLQATTSDDINKMRRDRAIILDGESKAEWLTKNVNNDHIRELKEDLTNRIYSISKTPKMEEFVTLGSGVAIQYKLLATETAAGRQERYFRKGLQRRIELITNVLKLKTPGIGDYRDVAPAFERNFIINDYADRIQALSEIGSGLMRPEEYRMKFYGETLEEAMEALPKMERLFGTNDY